MGIVTLRLSPAVMFGHGLARAGYIEAPRHPDLELRKITKEGSRSI